MNAKPPMTPPTMAPVFGPLLDFVVVLLSSLTQIAWAHWLHVGMVNEQYSSLLQLVGHEGALSSHLRQPFCLGRMTAADY